MGYKAAKGKRMTRLGRRGEKGGDKDGAGRVSTLPARDTSTALGTREVHSAMAMRHQHHGTSPQNRVKHGK